MILRRLSSAVKRQDWVTVLIEFVLVIAGVLIALQVNNWNEARSDRAEEAAFRERLAVDVSRAREQLSVFIDARERRLIAIAMVEDMYFGDAEIEPLSEENCTFFANMHILTHPPVAVPSITEAFAGGKIDLVSDTGLIRALLAVEQNEDRLRTVIDGMNLHRVDLSQEYP